MHCLVGFHLVALKKCGGNSVLVTFGGCHHLDSLKLVGSLSTFLAIVWCLRSRDCEGFYVHPHKIDKEKL